MCLVVYAYVSVLRLIGYVLLLLFYKRVGLVVNDIRYGERLNCDPRCFSHWRVNWEIYLCILIGLEFP